MKREVLVIFLLCALAAGVQAVNESVGTYDKSPGQNWTIDGHLMTIPLRENNQEDLVYVSFGETTQGIQKTQCGDFHNYEVCFINSTLGGFDRELQTSLPIYQLRVVANTVTPTIALKADKTELFIGQQLSAELDIGDTGTMAMDPLSLSMDLRSFDVDNVQGPCFLANGYLNFSGDMGIGATVTCTFDARPQKDATLTPKATYFNGRTTTTTTGQTVGITTRGKPMSVSVENTTASLGMWVPAKINLNNTYSKQSVTFKGSLSSTAFINGTTDFTETVGSGQSKEFDIIIRTTNVGNNTVYLRGSWVEEGEEVSVQNTATIIVKPLDVRIKPFGQLELQNGGSTKLDIEVQNAEEAILYNLTLNLTSPLFTLPPSLPTRLRPGENLQVYTTTLTPTKNDTAIPINITAYYVTEFGQQLRTSRIITVKTGKARAFVPPPAPKPVTNTPTSTTPATKPATTSKSATQSTTSTPQTNENIFIVLAIFAVIGGCVVYLMLGQRKGFGEE